MPSAACSNVPARVKSRGARARVDFVARAIPLPDFSPRAWRELTPPQDERRPMLSTRGGGLIAAICARVLQSSSLLRVLRIVAGVAQADEIIIHISQLRILVHVLDVMHFRRFGQPSVSSAVPAHIAVPAQNCGTLMLPAGAIVRKCFPGRRHGLSPPGATGATQKKPEPAINTRLCCYWLRLSKHWPRSTSIKISFLQSRQYTGRRLAVMSGDIRCNR